MEHAKWMMFKKVLELFKVKKLQLENNLILRVLEFGTM